MLNMLNATSYNCKFRELKNNQNLLHIKNYLKKQKLISPPYNNNNLNNKKNLNNGQEYKNKSDEKTNKKSLSVSKSIVTDLNIDKNNPFIDNKINEKRVFNIKLNIDDIESQIIRNDINNETSLEKLNIVNHINSVNSVNQIRNQRFKFLKVQNNTFKNSPKDKIQNRFQQVINKSLNFQKEYFKMQQLNKNRNVHYLNKNLLDNETLKENCDINDFMESKCNENNKINNIINNKIVVRNSNEIKINLNNSRFNENNNLNITDNKGFNININKENELNNRNIINEKQAINKIANKKLRNSATGAFNKKEIEMKSEIIYLKKTKFDKLNKLVVDKNKGTSNNGYSRDSNVNNNKNNNHNNHNNHNNINNSNNQSKIEYDTSKKKEGKNESNFNHYVICNSNKKQNGIDKITNIVGSNILKNKSLTGFIYSDKTDKVNKNLNKMKEPTSIIENLDDPNKSKNKIFTIIKYSPKINSNENLEPKGEFKKIDIQNYNKNLLNANGKINDYKAKISFNRIPRKNSHQYLSISSFLKNSSSKNNNTFSNIENKNNINDINILQNTNNPNHVETPTNEMSDSSFEEFTNSQIMKNKPIFSSIKVSKENAKFKPNVSSSKLLGQNRTKKKEKNKNNPSSKTNSETISNNDSLKSDIFETPKESVINECTPKIWKTKKFLNYFNDINKENNFNPLQSINLNNQNSLFNIINSNKQSIKVLLSSINSNEKPKNEFNINTENISNINNIDEVEEDINYNNMSNDKDYHNKTTNKKTNNPQNFNHNIPTTTKIYMKNTNDVLNCKLAANKILAFNALNSFKKNNDYNLKTYQNDKPSITYSHYNFYKILSDIRILKFNKIFFTFLDIKSLAKISSLSRDFYKLFRHKFFDYFQARLLKDKSNNEFKKFVFMSVFKNSTVKVKSLQELHELYHKNLYRNNKYDEIIIKDLNRTFPKDNSFKKGEINYEKLYRILTVYSNFNSNIGYAQGLNFLVGTSMYIFKEEESVFLFIDSMINKFNLSNFMSIDNKNVTESLKEFDNKLRKYIPEIVFYLNEIMLGHEFFTTGWILTLLSNSMEKNNLLITWCFMIIFGKKFYYIFIAQTLKHFKNVIVSCEENELAKIMKHLLKSEQFKEDFNKIVENTMYLMKDNVNL